MPGRNLIAKLKGFYPVTQRLTEDLSQLAREKVSLAAGEALIREGDKYKHIYLVDEGWMLRARYLQGGGGRSSTLPFRAISLPTTC